MAGGSKASHERSARPSTLSTLNTDWLPSVRPSLLMTDARVGPFVEAQKQQHWFLCSADTIYTEKKDSPQARMAAKLYAFLYD